MIFQSLFFCKFVKNKYMNIESKNICLNCEYLQLNFQCGLHNTQVEINSFCKDHIAESKLNKDSSCLNCASFHTSNCSFSSRSGKGMLCFDWTKKA